MIYGTLPHIIGHFPVKCREMMFYQYLPIKMKGMAAPVMEKRLKVFSDIIGAAMCDFVGYGGLDRFMESYVYLTAKYAYQKKGDSYNRPGWHSDGFLSRDINYIWSDAAPTIFNNSSFDLTLDDKISLGEMEMQAQKCNDISFGNNCLLLLDQFNIHRVDTNYEGWRTFLKISFSDDKYDLEGNSHNYELDYSWEMRKRGELRNIPQSI